MKDFKKEFPIFKNNSNLVYLDNAATTQKPLYVIKSVNEYLLRYNSNIHRGRYQISEISEKIYQQAKDKIKKFINGENGEVIFTYNASWAFNFVAWSLFYSNIFKEKGFLHKLDKILISLAEHHSNIVPWQLIKRKVGLNVEFISLDEEGFIDLNDFNKKYDKNTKVISLTLCSNVTGNIMPLNQIGKLKRRDTIFIVDISQAIPHIYVDVKALNCDIAIFSAHKIMGLTGLGVIWIKKNLAERIDPIFGGGGNIDYVSTDYVRLADGEKKWEIGTPNVVGVLSTLKAVEYLESIGGYEVIKEVERRLIDRCFYWANKLKDKIELIGTRDPQKRVSTFSFVIKNKNILVNDICKILGRKNICIRCGGHCAYPLGEFYGYMEDGKGCSLMEGNIGTIRIGGYIYNDKEDIDIFFRELDKII